MSDAFASPALSWVLPIPTLPFEAILWRLRLSRLVSLSAFPCPWGFPPNCDFSFASAFRSTIPREVSCHCTIVTSHTSPNFVHLLVLFLVQFAPARMTSVHVVNLSQHRPGIFDVCDITFASRFSWLPPMWSSTIWTSLAARFFRFRKVRRRATAALLSALLTGRDTTDHSPFPNCSPAERQFLSAGARWRNMRSNKRNNFHPRFCLTKS